MKDSVRAFAWENDTVSRVQKYPKYGVNFSLESSSVPGEAHPLQVSSLQLCRALVLFWGIGTLPLSTDHDTDVWRSLRIEAEFPNPLLKDPQDTLRFGFSSSRTTKSPAVVSSLRRDRVGIPQIPKVPH